MPVFELFGVAIYEIVGVTREHGSIGMATDGKLEVFRDKVDGSDQPVKAEPKSN
jgi:hypothetical protein